MTPPQPRPAATGRSPTAVLGRWGSWLATVSLAGFYLSTGAAQPPRDPGVPPAASEAPAAVAAVQMAPSQSDQTVSQLIERAGATFQHVRDYTCTLIKQERIGGRLQPEQTAQMRVRTHPFSVHLRFVSPSSVAGREACYVAGRNGGKMRARAGGLMGAVGFVTLDLRDPRVMADNRHVITEAGLGNLIERLSQTHEQERRLNLTRVNLAEYTFHHRPCLRLEAVHPANTAGTFYCYRCVTYFDRETGLPVRFEAYDYPRPGGNPGGELLECYSYVDLRFNVNLSDAAFNY
jgi:hypothetical protein